MVTSPSSRAGPLAGLVALTLVVSACNEILGIGDPKLGSGGATTSSSTTATGGAGGSGATGGQGGFGGEAPPPACAPTHGDCTEVDSECIALVDNSQSDKAGLRLQHVIMFKPDAFTDDLESWAITNAVTMNLPQCQLEGGGTLSWLLEFDEATGLTRLGVSKPVLNPLDGYQFVDETIVWEGQSFDVQPRTVMTSIEPDGTIVCGTIDYLVVPIYLNQAGTDMILVPLRQVRMYDTTISADRNCIGRYNAEGLSPDDNCQPDPQNGLYAYIDGGKVDGYIPLEEADQVIVTAFGLNRSLCVVLSGDAPTFGTGTNPIMCDRIAGEIKFPGDWCMATNQGATPSCHDAVRFNQGFAAAAVQINP